MDLTKHANLIRYAFNSITIHRVRTIATVTSLAITIMVLGSVAFLSSGLRKEAELSADFAPDITVQYLKAGRQVSIPTNYLQNHTSLGHYTAVPRVWGYISYETSVYTVMGIEPSRMPIPDNVNIAITKGRFIEEDDRGCVVVGVYLAKTLNLDIEDELTLTDYSRGLHNYTVIGIFSSVVRLYTADLILMNLDDARTLFEVEPELATDLCVYVDDATECRFIAQKLADDVPNIRVLTRAILKDALLSAYGARSGFVSIIWYILLIAVILVSWNQSSTISYESRREVGLLKALGFNTLDILEIRLAEAGILGIIATTIGISLAIIYDVYLRAPIIREFLLAWAEIYPKFQLPIYVEAGTVLLLYLVGVFPLITGSVIPAWLSAITEPDIAIRGV